MNWVATVLIEHFKDAVLVVRRCFVGDEDKGRCSGTAVGERHARAAPRAAGGGLNDGEMLLGDPYIRRAFDNVKHHSPTAHREHFAPPGHQIRRLHQISGGIFPQEKEAHGLAPVQFAAVKSVANPPGFDQRTLASTVAFDTSTVGVVTDRLEAPGLIARSASPQYRRARAC